MVVCCRFWFLLLVFGRDSCNDYGGYFWDCGFYDGDDKIGYVFEVFFYMRYCSEMNYVMLIIYCLLKKINYS